MGRTVTFRVGHPPAACCSAVAPLGFVVVLAAWVGSQKTKKRRFKNRRWNKRLEKETRTDAVIWCGGYYKGVTTVLYIVFN